MLTNVALAVSVLAAKALASQEALAAQTIWGQCGGRNWNGPTACVTGTYCRNQGNEWYSQCVSIAEQGGNQQSSGDDSEEYEEGDEPVDEGDDAGTGDEGLEEDGGQVTVPNSRGQIITRTLTTLYSIGPGGGRQTSAGRQSSAGRVTSARVTSARVTSARAGSTQAGGRERQTIGRSTRRQQATPQPEPTQRVEQSAPQPPPGRGPTPKTTIRRGAGATSATRAPPAAATSSVTWDSGEDGEVDDGEDVSEQ